MPKRIKPYAHLCKTNYKEYTKIYQKEYAEQNPEKFIAKDSKKIIKHNIFKELPDDVIPVNNFPTYYARPNGEVWRDTRGKESAIKNGKERVLRLTSTFNTHNGYWLIQPYQNDKKKAIHLHRFILTAFKGPAPEEKMECHHIDSNTSNNSIDNLMWVTRQQNADFVPRAHRLGPKKTYATGRAFSNTKWSHLYPQISELVNLGLRPADISHKLDMSPNLIYAIIKLIKNRGS